MDSPCACVTITYRDGSQREIRIGRETSDGNSCYVSILGEPEVHIVPSDFRQTMTSPLNELHSLPSVINKSVLNAVQLAVIDTAGDTISVANIQNGILPWQLQKPYAHAADTNVIEAVITDICKVSADGYETTVKDLHELQPYGLDKPLRAAVAFSDGTIRDLQIGNDAGNGEVYIRMDRSGDVYRVNSAKLDFLRKANINSMLDHFVLLVPIQQVSKVKVSHCDGVLLLEQRFSDNNEVNAYINGNAVTADRLSRVYSEIISLLFDQALLPEANKGEEVCSVDMTLNDSTKYRISYSTYDEWYYKADVSNGGSFLIRQEKVEKMLEAMRGV